MKKMTMDVVLDGEPKLKQVCRADIKLADSPHIVIAVPSGAKHDNTKLHCPKEVGGCGKTWEAPGARTPNLVPVQFMMAKEALAPPLNTSLDLVVESGRLSGEARQIMTKYAIRRNAKYILYWDDDTLPEWDGLYKLHRFMEVNPEVGAASGVYVTRESDFEPIIYNKHGEGAWWDFPRGEGAEPQPIWGCGAGFLLARVKAITDTIERMKEENDGVEQPIWADEYTIPSDSKERRNVWGHDIRFCYNLNKSNWPVYVHGAVLCGHLDIKTGNIHHMPMEKPAVAPSVDVIVVKYNQPEYEQRTIDAVKAHTEYRNYNLVVHQNPPGVALSKCWNDLIAESEADYVCLLNSDTVPAKGWLTKLMAQLRDNPERAAAVPSSNIVFLSQIGTPLDRHERDFDKINEFAAGLEPGIAELPTLSGMCALFSKNTWKAAGGFDEEFFLYGEDTEFFWRMKDKLKRSLVWVKDAYVHHYKAQSTDKARKDGMDLEKIRLESERMVNEKTDLDISHGELPAEEFVPGSHLNAGWTYQENPFDEDKSKVHRTDSSDRLRMLNTYGMFKDKRILDLGCNLGYFGFMLEGYEHYTGLDYDYTTVDKATFLRDENARSNMDFHNTDITPGVLDEFIPKVDVVFAFSVLPWIEKSGTSIADVLEAIKEKECYLELMYEGDAMSDGMAGIKNDLDAERYLRMYFKYVTKLGIDTEWRQRTMWKCSNTLGEVYESIKSPWSGCDVSLTSHGYVIKEYPEARIGFGAHEYAMLEAVQDYDIAPKPVSLEPFVMTMINGTRPTNPQDIENGHYRILDALEKEGIKHRDIRPENLLISQDRLYLLDFEWAIWAADDYDGKDEFPEGLGSQYRVPDFDNASTFKNVIEALK